ncbi:hypothetical protein NW768_007664 [Fusarium equiseti]|uniref:Uncharacterized protein n=1 Tax=Fusarium equiseti TaxID=61235 RepID=A0ABQ8R8F5_FUSEQ|nr:hypothetical protein NW768_007664 [Fusarium equiseti]
MSSEQFLAGKPSIVTELANLNGIGPATALSLGEPGANILIHNASNAAVAGTVVQETKLSIVQAIPVKVNASSESFSVDFVKATLEGLNNKLNNIVVNNAG